MLLHNTHNSKFNDKTVNCVIKTPDIDTIIKISNKKNSQKFS